MDGNGRLSRFLIHQALCCGGALDNGLLLPVSVAMTGEEQRYLEALQSFSKPARQFWDVRGIDADNLSRHFTGDPSLYRYWDATECVTFTLEMAKRALEIELRKATEYLQRCDTLLKVVNDNYDVRGSLLSKLIMLCLDQCGSCQRAGVSNTAGISKRRFSTSSKVRPPHSPTTSSLVTVAIE